ncbi:MAG: hypothetical protein KGM49_11475 [Sphingomonadales bacterium]|nr:hypothetical protein [Sphingomonadales bacterium]
MKAPDRRLIEDRETRRAARAVFDHGVRQVRTDLDARSVPGRIVDTAKAEATDALATGIAVARESKGIIATVMSGLLIWGFRAPLLRLARRLVSHDEPADVQADDGNALLIETDTTGV